MSRRVGVCDFQLHLQDVSYLTLCSLFCSTTFFQLGHVKNGTMGRLLLRGQDHRIVANLGLTVIL
jgi:hypothetical protein